MRKEKGKLIESPQTTTKRLVTHEMARQAYFKLHNHVYNGGKVPLLSIPRRDEDVDCILCDYIEQNEWAELREAESPRQADRTPQDYAIEHGGYLADAAQAYLDEKNRHDMAVAGYTDEVPDTDSLSDHHQALRNAIYEFRKRAEKSREISQHPVPAPERYMHEDELPANMPKKDYATWRVGSKVPINVYEDDRPVCQCHTAADAKRIVSAMNAGPVEYPSTPDNEFACKECSYSTPSDASALNHHINTGHVFKVARLKPVGSEVKPRTGDK